MFAGEQFALQVGMWSPVRGASIAVSGSDGVVVSDRDATTTTATSAQNLLSAAAVIPAANVTCYNTRGIDYRAQQFVQDVVVGANKVGALWFGVRIGMCACVRALVNSPLCFGKQCRRATSLRRFMH